MEEMKSGPPSQSVNKNSSTKMQPSNIKTPRVENKTPKYEVKADNKSRVHSEQQLVEKPSRKNSRWSDTASITSEESTQNRGNAPASSALKSPERSLQQKKMNTGFYTINISICIISSPIWNFLNKS